MQLDTLARLKVPGQGRSQSHVSNQKPSGPSWRGSRQIDIYGALSDTVNQAIALYSALRFGIYFKHVFRERCLKKTLILEEVAVAAARRPRNVMTAVR